MQLVVIREGRVGMHVGDVVDVENGDETTVFDLAFFSHIESDRSKAAIAAKAERENAPAPNPNPDEAPANSEAGSPDAGTPVLGDDDAMNEGAK